MSSRNSVGVNVGTISLLVIFLVMCLSIFSVLSLSTAKSELTLAEKSAWAVTGYFAADLACTEKVEQVVLLLQVGADIEGIINLVQSLKGKATLTDDMLLYLEFFQEIIPGLELQAVLVVEDGKMTVQSWKAVNIGTWEPDLGLNLWEGF